jgi:3-hydroxyisobutyrate dehydrogenase-like beta-hydroxyacid dehydrogenase
VCASGERLRIGLLHPGEMGASVGAAAAAAGAAVAWAREDRSEATRGRARAAGLTEVGTLDELVEGVEAILSVCPPHGALGVAEAVASRHFSGVFVDMNAIAPAAARRIGELVERAGASFVDGGIIGPPVGTGAGTRLYLSGPDAERVASLFAGSALEAVVVDQRPGSASAVKACFASWTKGSAALLLGIRALARAEGVEGALLGEWSRSSPGLAERSERGPTGSARKAWRWVGEMEQLAAAFRDAGLPDGFQLAAAEVFRRLERFRQAGDGRAGERPAAFDELVRAALGGDGQVATRAKS